MSWRLSTKAWRAPRAARRACRSAASAWRASICISAPRRPCASSGCHRLRSSRPCARPSTGSSPTATRHRRRPIALAGLERSDVHRSVSTHRAWTRGLSAHRRVPEDATRSSRLPHGMHATPWRRDLHAARRRHQVYLLTHPDHVKHVLQDNARAYAKGPPAARVRGLFGDSLTVVDGNRWRQRRRQVQPAFQPGQHAQFASVVTLATQEMLERWRSLAEGSEPVDAVTEIRRLTQTIIIRACFGDIATAEIEALGHSLDVAVGHVDRRLWSALGWLEIPTLAAGRYRRALRAIDAFVSQKVREARRTTPPPGSLL